MRFESGNIHRIQNPPCPPFTKGGDSYSPLNKGGIRGDFLARIPMQASGANVIYMMVHWYQKHRHLTALLPKGLRA